MYNFRNNATLRQQIKLQNQKIKREKKIREEERRVEEEKDDDDDEEEEEPDQKFRSFSQNQMAKKQNLFQVKNTIWLYLKGQDKLATV